MITSLPVNTEGNISNGLGNLVIASKAVMPDLKQFGSVNRGILGVAFPSLSVEEQYFKQQGIAPGSVNGVYIINSVSVFHR